MSDAIPTEGAGQRDTDVSCTRLPCELHAMLEYLPGADDDEHSAPQVRDPGRANRNGRNEVIEQGGIRGAPYQRSWALSVYHDSLAAELRGKKAGSVRNVPSVTRNKNVKVIWTERYPGHRTQALHNTTRSPSAI